MNHSDLVQKTVVRFKKTGPAIYHSHHDMMRFWERALRRADLPLRMTQGFNPHPRLVFPHALGLGVASLHEEIELELYRKVPLEELFARVKSAAGDTLGIVEATNLPPVKKSRQMVSSSYEITGWRHESLPRLNAAIADILARDVIQVERGAPGKRREMDIRPFLTAIAFDSGRETVLLEIAHTTTGSARPDEVARLIAVAVGDDPVTLSITKTAMRLE
ncbi:MAG: TIGR03936 family radical SAM-associated protein [Planctomycetes bacterium]|nr:TIGR03936 family radical SAM-associated protein [Planctomycetota bacterium]MCC8116723.1 TIGR03936 family radical SAM-associated protein [Planctomycetota bacterium]